MRRGPAAVADFIIASFDHLAPPTDVAEVIVSFGGEQGWFASGEESLELAESWRPKVLIRLRRAANDFRISHHPLRFDFNDSDPNMIQGDCFPKDGDIEEVKQSKLARSHFDSYRDAVRDLLPTDFEKLSRGILELIGCTDPILTRSSGDQGIDVFGEFAMAGRLNRAYHLGGPDSQMNTWIVGQAKRYTGDIGAEDIRAFIGAQDMARRGVFTGDGRALERFRAKPYQAVHLVYLTTGNITRGALELVGRSGLILMDEDSIAALLADHEIATLAGVFSAVAFSSWVADQV